LDSGNLARDSAGEGIEMHLSDGKCEFGDFSLIGGSFILSKMPSNTNFEAGSRKGRAVK
jgi:hypothetical protein